MTRRSAGSRPLVFRSGVLVAVGLLAAAAPSAPPSGVGAATPREPPPAPVQLTADRTPVVLVPGWSAEGQDLEPLKRLFVQAGWPDSAVAVVEFEDPEGRIQDRMHDMAR